MKDCVIDICVNVCKEVENMKINLKRRENFDVITSLQIVCCDILKNVTNDFEIIIVVANFVKIDVKIDIDKVDFELVYKNVLKKKNKQF